MAKVNITPFLHFGQSAEYKCEAYGDASQWIVNIWTVQTSSYCCDVIHDGAAIREL